MHHAVVTRDPPNMDIKKDCFEKSHNYCSIGDRTVELNIHLEDPVSTKTV
jgi:hypothetical protein